MSMVAPNGNIFRVTGPGVGNSTVTGEFPWQRRLTQGFDVFFYRCLKKRLGKQPRRRWFETPSRWLRRHVYAHTFPQRAINTAIHGSETYNTLWPRYSFMRHLGKPQLIQIMACHVFGVRLWQPMIWINTGLLTAGTPMTVYAKYTKMHIRNKIENVVRTTVGILSKPQYDKYSILESVVYPNVACNFWLAVPEHSMIPYNAHGIWHILSFYNSVFRLALQW